MYAHITHTHTHTHTHTRSLSSHTHTQGRTASQVAEAAGHTELAKTLITWAATRATD
jgi:hypothetical protein